MPTRVPSTELRAKLNFVQIGANDGVTEDPLNDILSTYDVRAVLIEPLPALGASLQQRYAGTSTRADTPLPCQEKIPLPFSPPS